MEFAEVKDLLVSKFGETAVVKENIGILQSALTVSADLLLRIMNELQQNETLYYDTLSCITGIDNGPQAGIMEVIYTLYSIPFNKTLTIKVELIRNIDGEPIPSVPSVYSIWRTANWHEREIFDLLGINFEGHPDLRRILLPSDWVGHPLRKDYKLQEYYHGVKTEY
ncbi:MAG TPA: NADH-quinone oxidoreductase subunit C [Cytophagaceae bacterium]|jgi:NADH-quinone oxidoreductase subunit C